MIEIEKIEPDDDVMTVEEFKEAVEVGFFTDDDGFGVWATSTHKSNIPVRLSELVPPQDMTHIVWFNK